MVNRSIEKKMQFIVKQRAKFAAAIQVRRENQAADSARMKEQSRALKRAITTLAAKIRKLEKAQQQRLRNADDPLKRLIDTIEERISENRSKRSEVRS